MRPLLVGSVVLALGACPALAQPAPPNPVLKQWPAGGRWQVLLVATRPPPDGAPACLLLAEDRHALPSNPMRWALRHRADELLVIENSMGVGDATIPELSLAIDGRTLGTFPITTRRYEPEHTPSVVKYASAMAQVADPAARRRIIAALRPGSVVRIERRGAAFEERLDANAASSFEACRREAETQGPGLRPAR